MQIKATSAAFDRVRKIILQRYAPAEMSLQEIEADAVMMDDFRMAAGEIIADINEVLAAEEPGSDETLAAITDIRLKFDAEVERHEAAMHEIALALVTLENGLLPAYSPEEEAVILEDHIMKMS